MRAVCKILKNFTLKAIMTNLGLKNAHPSFNITEKLLDLAVIYLRKLEEAFCNEGQRRAEFKIKWLCLLFIETSSMCSEWVNESVLNNKLQSLHTSKLDSTSSFLCLLFISLIAVALVSLPTVLKEIAQAYTFFSDNIVSFLSSLC